MKKDLLFKLDRGWLGGGISGSTFSLVVIDSCRRGASIRKSEPIGDPPVSQNFGGVTMRNPTMRVGVPCLRNKYSTIMIDHLLTKLYAPILEH